MKGQPFTWGEDNLGCRWREDGMGARRGKKDHANEWTSLSVGSWEPVQAAGWACFIGLLAGLQMGCDEPNKIRPKGPQNWVSSNGP